VSFCLGEKGTTKSENPITLTKRERNRKKRKLFKPANTKPAPKCTEKEKTLLEDRKRHQKRGLLIRHGKGTFLTSFRERKPVGN